MYRLVHDKTYLINTMEENTIRRVYEWAYLLQPTLDDEALARTLAEFRSAMTEKGMEIINDETPKVIDLAYTIEQVIDHKRAKFTQAYFGWIKFEAEPAQAIMIDAMAKAHGSVIRYLLIKTVRENTIAKRQPRRVRKDADGNDIPTDPALASEAPAAPQAEKSQEQAVNDALVDIV